MFNINYDKITGAIVSYQETPKDSVPDPEHNDVPDDCETLSFMDPVPGFQSPNGQILMKVDVATNKLVLLNPVEIPDPIQNPANAAK